MAEVFATAGADLLRARLDGKALLVTAGNERGKAVFEFTGTLLSGQSRTIVLDLSETPTPGRIRLLTPQPLVRAMTQSAVTTPAEDKPTRPGLKVQAPSDEWVV